MSNESSTLSLPLFASPAGHAPASVGLPLHGPLLELVGLLRNWARSGLLCRPLRRARREAKLQMGLLAQC